MSSPPRRRGCRKRPAGRFSSNALDSRLRGNDGEWMSMEKRVLFRSAWLPWLLVAPQLAIVLVFFFWPAGQALYQSVLQEDAFGSSREFVGLENFERLFRDSSYIESF